MTPDRRSWGILCMPFWQFHPDGAVRTKFGAQYAHHSQAPQNDGYVSRQASPGVTIPHAALSSQSGKTYDPKALSEHVMRMPDGQGTQGAKA